MLEMPPLIQTPSPNFSERNGHVIDTIVVHDCQGSGRGAASYFATRASGVSANFVCDEASPAVFECVPPEKKAWHACNANSYSIGIEMGGYAERGFPPAELSRVALIVAWLLHSYGIANRFVVGQERGGWTTHFRLGAFGGGHQDFTTSPTDETNFGKLVTGFYDQLGQGPLPAWALHGAPAPHQVSLPPAAPAGFTPRPHQLSDEAAVRGAATASGFPLHTVGDLQWKLRKVGANPALRVDTIEGGATEAAIVEFKRAVNLPATPDLTAAFLSALDRAAA